MTTQLWGWKYNGQDEVGTQKPGNSCVFKSEASEAIPILRHTDHITDLHKVKVVDADAVVIDKVQLNILRLAVKEGIEGIDSWRTKTYPQPDESVKARGALAAISQIVNGFPIPLTPTVTEPTGFGAVVEAQYYRATLRARFFFNGVDWIRERTLENYGWSDLINRIVISEGQK